MNVEPTWYLHCSISFVPFPMVECPKTFEDAHISFGHTTQHSFKKFFYVTDYNLKHTLLCTIPELIY